MFRAVPMLHMQIQVPNRDAAPVTRAIAAAGLLHLVDVAHGRLAVDAAPAGTHALLAAYRDLAARVRRLLDRLQVRRPDLAGAIDQGGMPDLAEERAAIDGLLTPAETDLDRAWTAARDTATRREEATAALRQARRLGGAAVPLDRLAALRFATVRLGTASEEALTTLATLLTPAPFAIVPLDDQHREHILAAVAVPASLASRLDATLRLVTFERVQPPARADEWALDTLEQRVTRTMTDEGTAAADLERAAAQHTPLIENLWRRIEVGVLLLQAQTQFGTTGRFVVISGWIPEEHAPALAGRITAVTAGRAVVTTERPDDLPEARSGALQIPILHRNPLLLRPFERLVELYGTPSYQEVQPTALFAFTFLLMFGLMFGDAGHGAVLFAAGYCLFRYVPRYLDYGLLLMECGAVSALFGALFGSFFGIAGLLPVIWMEPIRDLPRFMAMAAAFGVVIISLGLVLNVVNNWRAGERAAAVFSTRGLLGAFLYWSLIAVLVRALVPIGARLPGWVPIGLFAAALALLATRRPIIAWLQGDQPRRAAATTGSRWLSLLEGSVELVDALFGYFANTISFVRIAAFAAVHAGIFVAMFALSDTLESFALGGPLSVAALVAGNAVMILLEGLTVSVQVLRLEYYEFFGKFFRGGGAIYRPLMLRNGVPKGDAS